ncbi:DUF192 domain-containing protein [bacterium]|nr:DUF192 domain-containing protein [bacterium]
MKKIKILKTTLFILLIFLVFLFLILNKKKTEKQVISINNCIFNVDIAEDYKERYKGLSFREEINKNQGMLFVFNDKKIRTFVMRDMNFPIDIVFILDNQVVNFFKNCQPEEKKNLTEYKSLNPVNLVLEVPSGTIDRCNIKDGDYINNEK